MRNLSFKLRSFKNLSGIKKQKIWFSRILNANEKKWDQFMQSMWKFELLNLIQFKDRMRSIDNIELNSIMSIHR